MLAMVKRKLSGVRLFARWAHELGLSQPFETPKPRRPRGRSKPKSLACDERKAIIKTVANPGGSRGVLLIRTGLEVCVRLSEMAALKWSDVKMSKMVLVRRGKGNKERMVDLTKSLRKAFLEHGYLRHRAKTTPSSTASVAGCRSAVSTTSSSAWPRSSESACGSAWTAARSRPLGTPAPIGASTR